MKTLPFDLDKALAGNPVVTRDGKEVTEIHFFEHCKDGFPVGAVIDEEIRCLTKEGTYNDDATPHLFDLLLKPRTVKRWVNLYPAGRLFPENAVSAVNGYAFPSKELADESADIELRIACVEIEVEEP